MRGTQRLERRGSRARLLHATATLPMVWGLASGCASGPPPPRAAAVERVPAADAVAASATARAIAAAAGESSAPFAAAKDPHDAKGFAGGPGRKPLQGAGRPRVTRIPFRLSDLPVVQIGPAFENTQIKDLKPPRGTSPQVPRELAIGREVFVRAGTWVGFSRQPFGQRSCSGEAGDSWGKVVPPKGPDADDEPTRWVATRWESAARARAVAGQPAAWDYTVIDGWFDQHDCAAAFSRKASGMAKEIVPDLLYGLRVSCAECTERDAVVLLVPGARTVVSSRSGISDAIAGKKLGRAILPVRKGGAESMLASVDVRSAKAWATRLGAEEDRAALRFQRGVREILVDVEVSQGVADAEATSVAYLALVERRPGEVPPEPQEEGIFME